MTLLDLAGVGTTAAICSGISVELFPGHTAQMMGVHIESGGEHACYIGDLLPTAHHLDPTWVMGYDLNPLESMAAKQQFVAEAVAQEVLVFFEHDLAIAAGYIREVGSDTVSDPGSEEGKHRVVPALS